MVLENEYITLIYFITVLIIIVGFKLITWPKYALTGNRIAALGMALAIGTTMIFFEIFDPILVYVSILIGSLIGIFFAVRIRMAHIPQLVSTLNGLGAAAATIIPLAEIISSGSEIDFVVKSTALIGIIVGGLTFSGSILAAAKLHGVVRTRPIILPKTYFYHVFHFSIIHNNGSICPYFSN